MGNKKSIFQFVSPVFPSLPPHNSPVTRLLPVLWVVREAPLAPVSALIAGVSPLGASYRGGKAAVLLRCGPRPPPLRCRRSALAPASVSDKVLWSAQCARVKF